MGTGELNAGGGGNLSVDKHPIQGGGVEIFLVASYYRNRDKLRPEGAIQWLVRRLYLFYLVFQ